MNMYQLLKVWEVQEGMILRHCDFGRCIIIVVKTNPRSIDDGRSFGFHAEDLISGKAHEFTAAYPYQAYHPHLEYIGEAAK